MKTSDLLDERLAWPDEQRERGGPWRLGHGLASVGPGWWPLVRAAFAAAAETPGAEVRDVRQKFGALELWLQHEDAARRDALRAAAAACTEASRSRCEGCGAAVERLAPGRMTWRLHCADCAAFVAAAGDRAERKLWEWRAGLPWPPFDGW